MKQESIELYRKRCKKEAIIGVVFFAAIQLATMVCFGALCFIPDAPRWLMILFASLAAVCVLPMIGALVVMKQRFSEIEGGEAYDARQY